MSLYAYSCHKCDRKSDVSSGHQKCSRCGKVLCSACQKGSSCCSCGGRLERLKTFKED